MKEDFWEFKKICNVSLIKDNPFSIIIILPLPHILFNFPS